MNAKHYLKQLLLIGLLFHPSVGFSQLSVPTSVTCWVVNGDNTQTYDDFCGPKAKIRACTASGGVLTFEGNCKHEPYDGHGAHGMSNIYISLCAADGEYVAPDDSGYCIPPDVGEDRGCTGVNGAGNPCNVATGNKYQSETDFTNSSLSFIRSYNSQKLTDIGLGNGWRHNFQRKMVVNHNSIVHVSGSGKGEHWIKVNNVWQGDADSDVTITKVNSGFQLTKANNVIEAYSDSGQIESVTDASGYITTYAYNIDGTLSSVSNHYGQSVVFTYANGKLNSVKDALGAKYTFEFDINNNLVSVVYPDATDSTLDNPKRTYHYENTLSPNHLTGITDENGDRFATWNYDSNGKAISSEHAQTSNTVGQEKITLDYQGSP